MKDDLSDVLHLVRRRIRAAPEGSDEWRFLSNFHAAVKAKCPDDRGVDWGDPHDAIKLLDQYTAFVAGLKASILSALPSAAAPRTAHGKPD